MSAPTLPIDPQWVVHTLTPYLRYAFPHVLRRNFDIAPFIQHALNSSRNRPISSTDGDDLVFERVFFAIQRRHQGLPAELNGLTENLKSFAQFLIRRAQVKGPYELLRRDVQPSDAWKKYESERLIWCAAENAKAMQKQPVPPNYPAPAAAHQPAPPTFGMTPTPSPTYQLIDPCLLYASPGQFVAPGLSETLTIPELRYYQRRNQEIEASIAMNMALLPNQQPGHRMQYPVPDSQVISQGYRGNGMLPAQQGHHDGTANRTRSLYAPDPAFQQQYAPMYVPHPDQQQRAMPTQHATPAFVSRAQSYAPAQPAQYLLQQPGYRQPPGYPFRPPVQNIQQRPVPIASRPMPVQPVATSASHNNAHPGLPTLTKPAGIAKSTSKAPPTTASLPDFSDPAQRAASMAAFKKLSREEKLATLLEISRAEKAVNPNAFTPIERLFSQQRAEQGAAVRATGGDEDRVKQSKPDAEHMLKPVDQQTITVPAPAYQTHQDASTTTPEVRRFAPHPGYSNVTSSFASPQVRGPSMIPRPASKQEKK